MANQGQWALLLFCKAGDLVGCAWSDSLTGEAQPHVQPYQVALRALELCGASITRAKASSKATELQNSREGPRHKETLLGTPHTTGA
jgi:hypothetical protein